MTVRALRNELVRWLVAKGLGAGTKLYSQREWEERSEPYGAGAKLTLIIEESPLYAALNHGEPSWDLHQELTELAHRHGGFFELGNSWSVHFYQG